MDVDKDNFYASSAWRCVRERVIARDRSCVAAKLLGADCRGPLHVHHVKPRVDFPELALDEDNLVAVCEHHHPTWEALRRALMVLLGDELPPCSHRHPYAVGREECARRRREAMVERRLARV